MGLGYRVFKTLNNKPSQPRYLTLLPSAGDLAAQEEVIGPKGEEQAKGTASFAGDKRPPAAAR
jgi:hypothetical protein